MLKFFLRNIFEQLKMIEIVAKPIREQSPIYLTGEIVECLIEFTNPSTPQHLISQSNRFVLNFHKFILL